MRRIPRYGLRRWILSGSHRPLSAALDRNCLSGTARNWRAPVIWFIPLLLLVAVPAQAITRVNTNSSGVQGTGVSLDPAVSADGRYVAFQSEDTSLVAGDTNGQPDIFLKDSQTGQITLVSTSTSGTLGNGASYEPSVSDDGTLVVFRSGATDLVNGDNNGTWDIFLKHVPSGYTFLVSMSQDGQKGNGSSVDPVISADGRYVAFRSTATNLVAGETDTNGAYDIFRKELSTGIVERLSTDASGNESNGGSYAADISADGRYVVFYSTATNLVLNDTNGQPDIILKDAPTGAVTRVSTHSDGTQSNNQSYEPTISGNGRYVAFRSAASNLIQNDSNGTWDIFLKDTHSGVTSRVSSTSGGGEASGASYQPDLGMDGRYVVFYSDAALVSGDTNGVSDVFLKDMRTLATERLSVDASNNQGNALSQTPVLSGDGRYVVFESSASNLLPGSSDSNGVSDIFRADNPAYSADSDGDGLRDDTELFLGTDASQADPDNDRLTDFEEVNRDGAPYNQVDGIDPDPNDADTDGDGFDDGQEVGLAMDPYTTDTDLPSPLRVSVSRLGVEGDSFTYTYTPDISDDGRYVAFSSGAANLVASDTNGLADIFVKDTQTGAITLVSTDSDGAQANAWSSSGSVSVDGRYVAFSSGAANLVASDTNGLEDIFVKDTQTGAITRVSTDGSGAQAVGGGSFYPAISSDGRYVAFTSIANNLVAGDTNGLKDIFVKDTQTEVTTCVNTDSSGSQAMGGFSDYPVISADGRYVVFASFATNLVAGDTNGQSDIFVKDTQTGMTTRVSSDTAGGQALGSGSFEPAMSGNGRYVAFRSLATNLVGDDTNDQSDIFVKDTHSGLTTRISSDNSGAQTVGGNSYTPAISGDGRYVAFRSYATNLVTGDTNGLSDIFIKDTQTGLVARVDTDRAGAQAEGDSFHPFISADGRYVVFYSGANNLVAGDTNNTSDVFRALNPFFAPDTDGDGLRDDIEAILGTNPGLPDSDFDGLNDYQETSRDGAPADYQIGADTDPLDSDTDGDGFSDGTEISVGSDPTDPNDIPVYADGDIDESGSVNVADVLIGEQVLLQGRPMTPVEQAHGDVAPLASGTPSPDQVFDLGDILVIQRLATGALVFPVCGNTTIEPGEDCDDGNVSDGDGCSATCTLEDQDGDAVPDPDDNCPFNTNPSQEDGDGDGAGDACDPCPQDFQDLCIAVCGDGIVHSTEECDDGNGDNTDNCTFDCLLAFCGDGLVYAGVEQCDDGNTSDTDSCTGICNSAVCGDGFLYIGIEQCDDGNSTDGDGCSAACVLE